MPYFYTTCQFVPLEIKSTDLLAGVAVNVIDDEPSMVCAEVVAMVTVATPVFLIV